MKSEARFVVALQILAPAAVAFIGNTRQVWLLRAVAVFVLLTSSGFIGCGGGSVAGEELDPLTLDWASFRGTNGQGVSSDTGFPISWNEALGKGILWKSPVPLNGACSPIVCGNRVFLAGADGKERAVYCFDANTGALLWQRNVATSTTQEDSYDETGYAIPTVAMDGSRVFAAFGTGTVACFTYNGDAVWSVDFGLPDNLYGHASSLLVAGGLLIVQMDQNPEWPPGAPGWVYHSKLLALDPLTGTTVWSASDEQREVEASWSSPILIDTSGKLQVITVARPVVFAHDPATGTELWRVNDDTGVGSGDTIPSPAYAGGKVVVLGSEVVAISPEGSGDVTATHVEWTTDSPDHGVPSPVGDAACVYILDEQGTLSCLNTADGSTRWVHTLSSSKSEYSASPILAGGHLYCLRNDGHTTVLAVSSSGAKEVGTGTLNDSECVATPAFADGRIYIRTATSLYCISGDD